MLNDRAGQVSWPVGLKRRLVEQKILGLVSVLAKRSHPGHGQYLSMLLETRSEDSPAKSPSVMEL